MTKKIASFELVQYGKANGILEQDRPEYAYSAMGASRQTEKDALNNALEQLEKAGWDTKSLLDNPGFRTLASLCIDATEQVEDGMYWYVTIYVKD
jgi:hypothetical protein